MNTAYSAINAQPVSNINRFFAGLIDIGLAAPLMFICAAGGLMYAILELGVAVNNPDLAILVNEAVTYFFLALGFYLENKSAVIGGVVFYLVLLVISLVLFHLRGQTLGRLLVGTKVVRSNGDRCTVGRFLLRRIAPLFLMLAIPFVGWALLVADCLLPFDKAHRGLRDRFADTITIKA